MEMETEKTPKSFSSVGIFIIILLILGFVYFIASGKDWIKKSPPVVIDELDSSNQLSIITSTETIKVPEISDNKNITLKDLPAYIQGLFAGQAEDFLIKSASYADGTKGFSVEYTAMDTVKSTYLLFHKNSKTSWPPLDGGRTEGAAFLNIETEDYFIKAEFTKIEDTKTAVKVSVINK